MINVEDFLLKNNIELGTYTFVTYEGKIEPTWFTRYNFGEGDWFLESPCQLYKIMKVEDDSVDEFCKAYVEGILEDGADEQAYIDKYVKPMIIDGILYEINNFQCSPYLPEYVDNIEIITEKECLEYMLKNNKESEI